ncbi:MAG: hypothetical protein HC840_27955 [Leptolyngbyaceae cyanobacterium RM2_2_4]|nr:hypothetical protein [Leptolyngbyaceae cyanobacterium SL_5_14]NJO52602.1 hypothetical protein [Leptolyngbyaceae cyanobacterium RM2_2_4]
MLAALFRKLSSGLLPTFAQSSIGGALTSAIAETEKWRLSEGINSRRGERPFALAGGTKRNRYKKWEDFTPPVLVD